MNNVVVEILKKYQSPLIVGSYPPPLGGVSVHIFRLAKAVKKAEVYDTSVGGFFKYIRLLIKLLFGKNDLVHLHVLTLKMFVMLFVVKIFRPLSVMTTDHNSRLFQGVSTIKRVVLRYFLKKIDYCIVVGPEIRDTYLQNDIDCINGITVQNSFLPPPFEDEGDIFQTYPHVYAQFIESHQPIIITNAYQLTIINEVDLYGIDMCVFLVSELKLKFKEIGLVIFLADEKWNPEYLSLLKGKIKEKGVTDNVLFITGQKELWPAYKHSDLMIRPTYTDGFGVSVAEALYMGCPALASDVCERAIGAEIFTSRDADEFLEKSRLILCRKFVEKPES